MARKNPRFFVKSASPALIPAPTQDFPRTILSNVLIAAIPLLIMDIAKRAIIGYLISDNRGVGPCISSMRMAFKHLKRIPKDFKFIADGYSAYPLATQQFYRESEGSMKFDITQVIGLTNDDAVSTKYRPLKQMIERLNRTYNS